MVKSIEERDGRYSLAYVDRDRPDAWQRNPWGLKSPEAMTFREPTSTPDMLKAARADFSVEVRDVFTLRATPTANGKVALPVPFGQAVVRTDLDIPVGLVGNRFTPVDYATVAKTVADSVNTGWDSMAVLDGGSQWYGQIRLTSAPIRPNDKAGVERYLTATAGHDGATPIVIGITDVNIVCANTLRKAILAISKDGKRIKHTRGAHDRLIDVAAALEEEHNRREADLETYRAMATDRLNRARVADVLKATVPGEHTRAENVRKSILAIFEAPAANTGVEDTTAWDLFQAVTFYTSHEATLRGMSDATAAEQDATRRLRLSMEGSELADRAFRSLLATAA